MKPATEAAWPNHARRRSARGGNPCVESVNRVAGNVLLCSLIRVAFLTIGSLSIVSSVPTLCIAAGSAQTDSNLLSKIRVGVITQSDGPHLGIYFRGLANARFVSGVAVADASGTTFESAKRMLGRCTDFAEYRDPARMIAEFRPHLVLIAMAAHRAPEQIRTALSAGCHVLAEKPACVRPEDFRPLVRLARETKLNLMLALPSRLAPDTLRAREIVGCGWIGKPYGVTFHQVKDQARLTRPEYQKSWFASPNTAGGGHLIWLGIHSFDQLFFITNDRVAQVTGFVTNAGGQSVDIEDSEAVAFRFQSGMLGTFQGGYYVEGGSYQAGTTIWGSEGWIRLSGSRDLDGSKRTFQWYSTHKHAPRGVHTEDWAVVNSYQLLIQAAIDSTRGHAPAPLTGNDSLHVLEVIFGAYRASETGRVQTIEQGEADER